MMTMASERGWLLDPSLLKLVHQCRRLIQSEFGVKLHLTEEHLEQRLASYAGQSRSEQLSRTWQTLKERVPELAEEEAPGKKTYRGQEIAGEEATDPTGENAAAGSPGRKKVIYRGRVIYQ